MVKDTGSKLPGKVYNGRGDASACCGYLSWEWTDAGEVADHGSSLPATEDHELMVGIVVDSAAALDPELAASAGITVVPLMLDVDGHSVPETSLGIEEITGMIRTGRARTAGPSPGAFIAAIEAADTGEGVLVLTVGKRFSSSVDAARIAALQADREVQVVDTRTAAGGQALVTLASACAGRSGLALDAVAKLAEEVADRVRLVAAVGDLAYLGRSGRLPRSLAALGNSVGLQPVFQMQAGSIRLLRPGLSQRAAMALMLDTWRRSVRPGEQLHVAAMHAGREHVAQQILSAIQNEVIPTTSLTIRFGPAMIAHTGPELEGLAWWWEPVEGTRGGDPR